MAESESRMKGGPRATTRGLTATEGADPAGLTGAAGLAGPADLAGPARQGLTRRRLLGNAAAAGALVGLGPLLSACGGGSGGGGGGGGGKPAVYLGEDVASGLDWDGASAAIPIVQFAIDQTYGRLVRYEHRPNSEGVLVPDFDRLVGELAESWQQNGLRWTFKLRQGIKSAAGNELTADDVVWTFARAKSVSGASPIAWFLLNVASVMPPDAVAPNATAADKKLKGEIRKVDRYTVEIRQQQPNLLFPRVLAIFALSIVDSTEAKKHATPSDPWAHDWMNNQGTAGFGPYRIARWNKGQDMIFQANPNWKGGALVEPRLKTVTLRKVPSTSVRTASMKNGSADMATNLTSRNFADLRQDQSGSAKVVGVLGNENMFLHMNFKVKPWDNVKLRQAMAYAMPYDAIIKAGYFGQAQRWYGVVPPTYPGYEEVRRYDTNLSRARQLLAEAGYPGGQGLSRFGDALNLYYVAEKQDQLQPIAVQMQTALRRIGVAIQLTPIPQSQYGDRQLAKKDLPLALNDQEKPIAPDAGYAVQLFFISTEKGGLNNMVNYSNPTVDRLWLEQAKNEPSGAKRNQTLARIQQILMDDVVWLPVVLYRTQVALAKDLSDYAWDPDNALRMKYFRRTAS